MKKYIVIILLCVLTRNLNAQIEAFQVTNAEIFAGKLLRISKFPSKHITPRNVDIWLPGNYSKDKKYAVWYMHDGQMLFDATTTWNQQEWMVDEVATELMTSDKTRDFIVVAIHNISETRYADMFPQKSIDYLSSDDKEVFLEYVKKEKPDLEFNADYYLKYIVEEIKPYIDTHFSTLKDRDHTFVAGSSAGALISWYAICEYPEVFGGAACLSTHWPGGNPEIDGSFPQAFFNYIESNMPDPKTHKLYFDFGTETLDAYYPKYEVAVSAFFKNAGYTSANFINMKFEGADHSETSWQTRLHIPFTFLMSK